MRDETDDARRLEWVQRNRTRPRARQPEEVGPLVRMALAATLRSRPRGEREVWAALWDRAGAELMDGVLDVELRGGVLRLSVVDPARRYRLRLTWEQRLLGLLGETVPQVGVYRVVFAGPRRPR